MSKGFYLEKKKKVFVGMSGGVDSSVAALLLKRQGFDVTGVFIRSFNIDGCAEADAFDARRVAEQIGVPFYIINLEEEYKRLVVDYMVREYGRGRTPNPDVMCNREIKFGLFYERAMEMGADYVATGHYAKIKKSKIKNQNDNLKLRTEYSLQRARDENKDQTYFLWGIQKERLERCLFPIGDYSKSEVRKMALEAGLLTANKKDSQGICFLGDVSMIDFLKDYLPQKEGRVVTMSGALIGRHNGAHFYTIGQRHGLALGKKNKELGIRNNEKTRAHYVARKDLATNTVVVAEGSDHEALYKKEVVLKGLNFLTPEFLTQKSGSEISLLSRIRYRQPLSRAVLSFGFRGECRLVFNVPQKYVASGQSAVFYDNDGCVLGGGIIDCA